MRMSNDRGFTLLEALTGLALSGIVMAMILPTGADLLAQYRLRGAVSQLSFELTRARMQAVGQNAFVRLRFDENGTYYVERSDDGVAFNEVVSIVQLPNGVSVTNAQDTPVFGRRGIVAGGVSLNIQNGSGQRTVEMNTIGRVTES